MSSIKRFFFGDRGILRLIIKYIRHLLSGKSEMERILLSTSLSDNGVHQSHQQQLSSMTLAVRRCLSRSKRLAQECAYLDIPNPYRNSSHDLPIDYNLSNPFEKERIVQSILDKKSIFSNGSREKLNVAIAQLVSIKEGIKDLKLLSKIQFSHQSAEHQSMLIDLWESINVGDKVDGKILDKDWSSIGFQGKDPQTDFRGMGLLGLINLLKFVKRRGDLIQRIMNQYCDQNRDSTRALPFAITGINVTSITLELVERRKFDNVFIRLLNSLPRGGSPAARTDVKSYDSIYLEAFQRVYDKMLSMLLREWANKNPDSIMQFRSVREDYLKKVNDLLDGLADASDQSIIDFFSGMTVRRDLEIDEMLN